MWGWAIVGLIALSFFALRKFGNLSVEYEESCARSIKQAMNDHGVSVENGTARVLLRNAVDVVNRLNAEDPSPVYISLRRSREIALNGILEALESDLDPLESVALYYNRSRGRNRGLSAGLKGEPAHEKNPLDKMAFKNAECALEYASMYMDVKPKEKHTLPGVVMHIESRQDMTVSIPSDLGVEEIENIALSDRIDEIAVGDFVLVGIARVIDGKVTSGVVLQRIEPVLNLSEGIWEPA